MDLNGKHYTWFQNRECEYFPCHKGVREEEFNCLFCYCPLYRAPDCRGSFDAQWGERLLLLPAAPQRPGELRVHPGEAAGGEALLSRAGMTYHKTKSPGGTAKAVPPGD